MSKKYPIGWENLSLDWNSHPVMWWITSSGEIRQLVVSENWAILSVAAPINSSATWNLLSWQVAIATTNTQVGMPTADVWQFVVIKALSTNVWNIFVWPTGVTSANGLILEPGDMLPIVIDKLNKVFINWTSWDKVSYSLT